MPGIDETPPPDTPSSIGAEPSDSDLAAIAALATTPFGRSLLTLADAAAARAALALGTAATHASTDFDSAGAATAAQAASQPLDSDLTAIAALTTTTYGRAFLALADAAAGRTALGLGTLATKSAVASADITDGTIVDGDVSASAAIATSKLADSALISGAAQKSSNLSDLASAATARTNLNLISALTKPSAALAETYPRYPGPLNDITGLTSALLYMTAIVLEAGTVISSITFCSGGTPLSVGLNQHFSLWNSSRQFLAATSDDTSTAWVANARKTLNIATTAATPGGTRSANSTYTIPTTGLYFIGIMVKATTFPSLRGSTNQGGQVLALPPTLVNIDVGPYTDPTSLPNTAVASGQQDAALYAYVS